MNEKTPSAAEIRTWLTALGIDSLCQWDVVVFLYRHQNAILAAEHLASLIGYACEPVMAALDTLASLGLVKRSRLAHGARLYHLTMPVEAPDEETLRRLMALVEERSGRLLVSGELGRDEAARSKAISGRAGKQIQNSPVSDKGLQRRRQRKEPWLKVV